MRRYAPAFLGACEAVRQMGPIKRTGGGGVTEVDAHAAWGDPFVEQWKAFYENVDQN
jgi:hypothetical protein